MGSLSSLSAILLVLASKSHRRFIHRIFLYLATSAFMLLSASILNLLSFKCAALLKYLLVGYSSYVYFLLLFWIIFYLFLLAAFRVQLNRLKHEVIGVVAVLVLPLSVEWVIPWKFDSDNFSAIYLYIFYIPVSVVVLVSSIMLAAVLFCLIRGALKRDAYSSLHKKAIIEAMPLLVFIGIHQVVILVILSYHVVASLTKLHISTVWKFVFDLYPASFIAFPVLLLMQPDVRRNLFLQCKKRTVSTSTQQSATIQNASCTQQTSNTHYTVPAETSYTEQEPLIIRQQ